MTMTAYDNTREELRQLRKQVDELMESRVTPMLSDAAHRASDAAHRAREYTGERAEQVADRVRDMPLVAIGVAAAVGFLFGRFTR
jgi:ElaB/YqjD/DUF883 family membrane-anchored ribosome-binding protein